MIPEYKKQGLTRNEYEYVHRWVKYHYGPANKCESENCSGKHKDKFHYALVHGKKYERNRDNYIMLCPECHSIYDFTEEKRHNLASHEWTEDRKNKIRIKRTGHKASPEARLKMSIRMSGKGNHMYGVSITGKDHHFYGKSHSEESREKIRSSRATLSKDDVEFIRLMHSRGIDQRSLCRMFRLAPPYINKLIKMKTYATW